MGRGAGDFLMRGDILGCSENGEITIEYCSSNNKEHAGFIARIVRMGPGLILCREEAQGS
jgi:hypothetical protein